MLQVKHFAKCQKLLGKFVSRSSKTSRKIRELFLQIFGGNLANYFNV